MVAPAQHCAMKHAIGPRKEMGVRTVFNVLGPLTNPAGAPNQVLGVFKRELVRPIAEVLQRLGSHHVMVVHAADGLDEITVSGTTYVAELVDGEIREYQLEPQQFGLDTSSLDCLVVADSEASLALIRQALAGEPGAAADIIKLNAGAAIYVSGLASSLAEGVNHAAQLLQSGAALAKLDQLVTYTRSLA